MLARSRLYARSAVVCVVALVLGAAVPVASADTAPPDVSTPATVSADALPTVQVDGVVWAQAVVGNTVYAGGQFTTARPAGAAPGVSTTTRNNLLAYDIRTGALVTSFAPSLNGQVLSVAASPDGTRVYVAGEFTTANGQSRSRIAAYDTATGALVSTFRPTPNSRVRALAVSNSAVYAGGDFTAANGVTRTRLAGFSASNGGLLTWNPSADASVVSMVLAPGDKVVAGGRFTNVSGTAAYGMAAMSTSGGTVLPWAATSVVKNAGANAAINSLTTDGELVYGTGYVFGSGGNFEGTFAARPDTGQLAWLEDCHGDTYGSFATGGAVYTAGHAHMCSNIGGFPETSPRTWHRGLAFTKAATGKVSNNTQSGYANFGGQPAPSLLTWWPDLDAGTFTGQNQGPWSVSGNSGYVVMGGEFPRVNGTAQQGLVRFAVRSAAPNKEGPRLAGVNFRPTLASLSPGTVRVTWPANWDRDNEQLTYGLVRDGNTAAPVFVTSARSTFWNRPTLGFKDVGLTPGRAYSYRLYATDPLGNTVVGDPVTITAAGATTASTYADAVAADGASSHWRLGELSGPTAYDHVGFSDLSLGATVSRGAAGAITGDTNTASSFDGTATGTGTTSGAVPGPDTFSVESWFRTTSTTGGKVVGFGNRATGVSSSYDRHVYLNGAGQLSFGLYNGGFKLLSAPGRYNDGAWHHVVATVSSAGTSLFVDGTRVASDASATKGQAYNGYWRVGGDNLDKWPNAGDRWFDGDIDEVAVYPRVLTADQVSAHYALEVPVTNAAPVASFTATASDLTARFDGSGSKDSDGSISSYRWDFGDGTTGTGATPTHTYAAGGTYTVRLTVVDDKGAAGTTTKAVTVQAPAETSPAYASDSFSRTVSSGWGSAETGGAWSLTGSSVNYAVSAGAAKMAIPTAGTTLTARLDGASASSTDLGVAFSLDKPQTGGGTYLSVLGRRVGTTGDYRLKLRVQSTGAVSSSLVRVVSGTETTLATQTLAGITYAPGEVLQVRLQVNGVGTTSLAAKVWRRGAAEPAGWQLTTTDTTAGLQAPGSPALLAFLSGSSTSAPMTVTFDDLSARPVA